MDYKPKPNPFLDEIGILPLEGKDAEAFAFAQADYQEYLQTLTSQQREQIKAADRNFQAHVDSAN